MLERLRLYLSQSDYEAPPVGALESPAAVLIAITEHEEAPAVVLTRRSLKLKNHSGEVSLPGGKWEPQDRTLQETALREAEEEIGLDPGVVEVLGALPVFQTWKGVNVAPFVGVIPPHLEFVPNYDELDEIFLVPLSFFVEDQRIRTDVFEREVGHVWSPAYEFDGFEIWGFTARLLINFLNDAFEEVEILRESPAPIKDWSQG
ncbi:CoA pyrophosphatase [Aestuariicella hydrocarbonica]|uniref:CoA pyrophosphatase n=2 Tax=Pseudomaricurvus hydrocarbonicus TaxID=1470433 RepID=A0A9E5JYL4_9GAMM|nr:CoA pyrophosphatase [Aestuariicella hydrocarbonica]